MAQAQSPRVEEAQVLFHTSPHCALDGRSRWLAWVVIAIPPIGVGLWMAANGAWLVLPFSGAEVVALGWGLYEVGRRSRDWERILATEQDLLIEVMERGKPAFSVFPLFWVRVFLEEGNFPKVLVRAYGKTVEVGRFLGEEGRRTLASDLRGWLEEKRKGWIGS